jgi:hypothetical protein
MFWPRLLAESGLFCCLSAHLHHADMWPRRRSLFLVYARTAGKARVGPQSHSRSAKDPPRSERIQQPRGSLSVGDQHVSASSAQAPAEPGFRLLFSRGAKARCKSKKTPFAAAGGLWGSVIGVRDLPFPERCRTPPHSACWLSSASFGRVFRSRVLIANNGLCLGILAFFAPTVIGLRTASERGPKTLGHSPPHTGRRHSSAA